MKLCTSYLFQHPTTSCHTTRSKTTKIFVFLILLYLFTTSRLKKSLKRDLSSLWDPISPTNLRRLRCIAFSIRPVIVLLKVTCLSPGPCLFVLSLSACFTFLIRTSSNLSSSPSSKWWRNSKKWLKTPKPHQKKTLTWMAIWKLL